MKVFLAKHPRGIDIIAPVASYTVLVHPVCGDLLSDQELYRSLQDQCSQGYAFHTLPVLIAGPTRKQLSKLKNPGQSVPRISGLERQGLIPATSLYIFFFKLNCNGNGWKLMNIPVYLTFTSPAQALNLIRNRMFHLWRKIHQARFLRIL